MKMNSEQIQALEKEAERHDGRCSKCNQTIKIYRYKINKTHATFLKAMANAVRDSGVNDVDIATIGLSYSIRTQVTKMRLHGLIARVKTADGAQAPRRWLITHKGWEFLNGKPVAEKVVIYNNQVLGHDNSYTTIYDVLMQRFDPQEPIYAETPVSAPEARVLDEVRQPRRQMEIQMMFKGSSDSSRYEHGQQYDLVLDRLHVGKPVTIISPHKREYRDIAAFQKDWRAV